MECLLVLLHIPKYNLKFTIDGIPLGLHNFMLKCLKTFSMYLLWVMVMAWVSLFLTNSTPWQLSKITDFQINSQALQRHLPKWSNDRNGELLPTRTHMFVWCTMNGPLGIYKNHHWWKTSSFSSTISSVIAWGHIMFSWVYTQNVLSLLVQILRVDPYRSPPSTIHCMNFPIHGSFDSKYTLNGDEWWYIKPGQRSHWSLLWQPTNIPLLPTLSCV